MIKAKSYKKWLTLLLGTVAGLLLVVAAFNWAVDPLWCFSHPRWLSRHQKPFNERHQKTNHLTFGKAGYDAVIVGNSRTSLISQFDFAGMHAYNYSVPGMTGYEFRDYLNYFKKMKGEPKTIVMGIDFDNTDARMQFPAQRPQYFFDAANSSLYRYRTLFTGDTLKYSRENLTLEKYIRYNNHGGGAIVYGTGNVAILLKPMDEKRRQEYIAREVDRLRNSYRSDYRYRADLADEMRKIKVDHPGSRFITFTTPVSKLYFCAMVQEGKLPEYERWLKEMVGVFGEVWNFQYLNSVTNDYATNYSDSHHYYPYVGTYVAHKVTGVPDPKIPADFGVLLNKDNIDAQLAKIRSSSAACQATGKPGPVKQETAEEL